MEDILQSQVFSKLSMVYLSANHLILHDSKRDIYEKMLKKNVWTETRKICKYIKKEQARETSEDVHSATVTLCGSANDFTDTQLISCWRL